jgi:hypothetical protein
MVDEVSRVGVLDRESHGAWYEIIANATEQRTEEAASSSSS